ncbi:MAG TPA: EamA family transporter [Myxococcota bacterium]|nr:EamA family transporter [Myxococcota bacterium]
MSPSTRSILLVVAAMAAFSLMALFTRAADASAFTVAAWRGIFVALAFGSWMIAKEGPRSFKVDGQTLRIAGIMGVALAVASGTFVAGYVYTTVANTIFLHNLAPVVVLPLAWWAFRERPGAAVLAGAAIAVAGIALLSGVSFVQVAHFANPQFLLGDGLALVSALGYAVVLVVTRESRQRTTPIVATLFYAWLIAAVLLTATALLVDTMAASWTSLLWIVGLALVCTNLPFVLLNLGMRRVGAGLASVLSLSEVVFATLLGVVVYGEDLSPAGWLGGGLAVIGVLYALRQGGRDFEDPRALPHAARAPRLVRLGLALVALNAAGIASLLGGGAALLAFWAFLRLSRGAPSAVAVFLGARRAAWARWGAVALSGVAGVVVLTRASEPEGSVFVLAGALLLWGVDRYAADKEPAEARDHDRLGQLALLAVVAAEGFALLAHDASIWTTWIARAALALAALEVVASGIRGSLHLRPAPPPLGDHGRWFRAPVLVAAALLFWLLGGVHAVPAGHVGIVERFGAPQADLAEPGLLIQAPPPIDRVVEVHVARAREVEIVEPGTPLLCGDQGMVSLSATLAYRVDDPVRWTYGYADPDAVLAELARSALVEILAGSSADEVLAEGRADVEERSAARTQVVAAELGATIDAIHLQVVRVPPPVQAAFLDVISADEERLTTINEAHAYAAQVLPEAGGRAVEILAAADISAFEIGARAEVDRQVFEAISRGGSPSDRLTRERLAIEHAEATLAPAKLLVVPRDLRLWMGDVEASPTLEIP